MEEKGIQDPKNIKYVYLMPSIFFVVFILMFITTPLIYILYGIPINTDTVYKIFTTFWIFLLCLAALNIILAFSKIKWTRVILYTAILILLFYYLAWSDNSLANIHLWILWITVTTILGTWIAKNWRLYEKFKQFYIQKINVNYFILALIFLITIIVIILIAIWIK